MRAVQLVLVGSALLVQSASCGRDTPRSSSGDHAAGAPSAPSTATKRKPCEYVARADAEAAVGEPLPTTLDSVELHECEYTTPLATGMTFTIAPWESMQENIATYERNTPSVAVTGVGDQAVRVPRALFVRKGDRGFKLELSGAQIDALPDFGFERAKTLALKIFPGV